MPANNSRPVANPLAILREDFDDWSILFDPDSIKGFGLSPVSVFVWKQLDGRNTVQDIMSKLRASCDNVPEQAEDLVRDFIHDLVERGLAGYQLQKGWANTDRRVSDGERHERIEWSLPALTELGHEALDNVAAYALGESSSGGGCGCSACGGS